MNETDFFRAALKESVSAMGRGAQRRIADSAGMDPVYLNGIINGHKPGSESIRSKIAEALGMTYEQMLSMGRQLLSGEKTIAIPPVDVSGIPPDIIRAARDPRIQAIVLAAAEAMGIK